MPYILSNHFEIIQTKYYIFLTFLYAEIFLAEENEMADCCHGDGIRYVGEEIGLECEVVVE